MRTALRKRVVSPGRIHHWQTVIHTVLVRRVLIARMERWISECRDTGVPHLRLSIRCHTKANLKNKAHSSDKDYTPIASGGELSEAQSVPRDCIEYVASSTHVFDVSTVFDLIRLNYARGSEVTQHESIVTARRLYKWRVLRCTWAFQSARYDTIISRR